MLGQFVTPTATAQVSTADLPATQLDIRNVTGRRFIELSWKSDTPDNPEAGPNGSDDPVTITYPTSIFASQFAYDRRVALRTIVIGLESFSILHTTGTGPGVVPFKESDRQPIAISCSYLMAPTQSRYMALLSTDSGTGLFSPNSTLSSTGDFPSSYSFTVGLMNLDDVSDTQVYNFNKSRTTAPIWNTQQIRAFNIRLFLTVQYEPNKIPVYGTGAADFQAQRQMLSAAASQTAAQGAATAFGSPLAGLGSGLVAYLQGGQSAAGPGATAGGPVQAPAAAVADASGAGAAGLPPAEAMALVHAASVVQGLAGSVVSAGGATGPAPAGGGGGGGRGRASSARGYIRGGRFARGPGRGTPVSGGATTTALPLGGQLGPAVVGVGGGPNSVSAANVAAANAPILNSPGGIIQAAQAAAQDNVQGAGGQMMAPPRREPPGYEGAGGGAGDQSAALAAGEAAAGGGGGDGGGAGAAAEGPGVEDVAPGALGAGLPPDQRRSVLIEVGERILKAKHEGVTISKVQQRRMVEDAMSVQYGRIAHERNQRPVGWGSKLDRANELAVGERERIMEERQRREAPIPPVQNIVWEEARLAQSALPKGVKEMTVDKTPSEIESEEDWLARGGVEADLASLNPSMVREEKFRASMFPQTAGGTREERRRARTMMLDNPDDVSVDAPGVTSGATPLPPPQAGGRKGKTPNGHAEALARATTRAQRRVAEQEAKANAAAAGAAGVAAADVDVLTQANASANPLAAQAVGAQPHNPAQGGYDPYAWMQYAQGIPPAETPDFSQQVMSDEERRAFETSRAFKAERDAAIANYRGRKERVGTREAGVQPMGQEAKVGEDRPWDYVDPNAPPAEPLQRRRPPAPNAHNSGAMAVAATQRGAHASRAPGAPSLEEIVATTERMFNTNDVIAARGPVPGVDWRALFPEHAAPAAEQVAAQAAYVQSGNEGAAPAVIPDAGVRLPQSALAGSRARSAKAANTRGREREPATVDIGAEAHEHNTNPAGYGQELRHRHRSKSRRAGEDVGVATAYDVGHESLLLPNPEQFQGPIPPGVIDVGGDDRIPIPPPMVRRPRATVHNPGQRNPRTQSSKRG